MRNCAALVDVGERIQGQLMAVFFKLNIERERFIHDPAAGAIKLIGQCIDFTRERLGDVSCEDTMRHGFL